MGGAFRVRWLLRLTMVPAAVLLVAVGMAVPAAASAVVTGKPGAPTAVSAVAQDEGALVSWTPPSSGGGSPITAYVITALPGGAMVRTAAVTSFEVGGLADGTAYTFTVAAVNASGRGPASSPSAAVTPQAAAVPGPPRSVTAVAGFEQVSVSWAVPKADGRAPVTGYRLTTTPATTAVTVGGDARSATLSALSDGTAYKVAVAAVNSAGRGKVARSAAVTPQVTAPGAPLGVAAAPVASGVKVSWQPPASDGGTALTGYAVTVAGTSQTITAGPGASSVTVTGLTSGTSYTFGVAASNAQGTGPAQASPSATAGGSKGSATVVLSAASLAALTQVQTNGSLVFTSPPAQVKNLAAGDIVVAGVSTATPDGLMANVTSVSTSGSSVTVATVPASLDQALSAAGFGTSTALTQGQVAKFVPARPGVKLLTPAQAPASAAAGSISLSLDTDLYKSADGSTVTVDGDVSLSPSVSFAAQISCCVHTASQFTGSVTASASLSVTAQTSHDISGGYTLGTFGFTPIAFDVLGVPVVIVPSLTVKLIAKGSVTAGVTADAGASVTVGATVTTQDSNVSAHPFTSHTTSYTPPTLYGSMSAAGGVEADLSATVNGIAGATLTDQLWLAELSVDPSQNPWWTLSAENVIEVDFDLTLLDHTFASYSKTLSDVTIPLAQATGPYQGITITPNPAVVAPGGTLQLAAEVAGVAAQNVTWNASSGNGTITAAGLYTAPSTPGTYQVIAAQPAARLNPGATGLISIQVGDQPPGPPTSADAASTSYGAATITWTPPAGTITGYTIAAQPGGATYPVSGSAASDTISGLTPGATYTFAITATSDGGTSLPSPATNPVEIDNTSGGAAWGTAIEVPGTASLNTGGIAQVNSVSCASAGNCGAGGYYTPDTGGDLERAFVVSEVNGTWGTAIEVPGTASNAAVEEVSCASAGNCSAGGSYTDAAGNEQAFVVSEVNGTWGTAIEVPGTASLNSGGSAAVDSVSCASAGNCSAGGAYYEAAGSQQAFVVSEVNGTWGTAIEVPGTASLNSGGFASVGEVSCASAGNCSAGGSYTDAAGNEQAFVVSEVNGTWGTAIEVPGTASLNSGGFAGVFSVSCASAGNCSAGGYYTDGAAGNEQAFVVSEVNGTWGTAIEVPGTSHGGVNTAVNEVSCASAGNCSAGGAYYEAAGSQQAFVVSEVNGTWGTAIEVPGTAALNTSGSAGVFSVSCASAGNCSAGGYYSDAARKIQAFVVSEVNGTWGTAIEVPGTASLNTSGFAGVGSVSCASAGNCSAGGEYDAAGKQQTFVVSER